MRSRGPHLLLFVLTLLACAARGQAPSAPPVLQFARTVNVALSRGQVSALVSTAWENSFGLDPGAKLEATNTPGGVFEGSARIAFRSQEVTAREQSAGYISYRVTITAENGSCQVRVTNIQHRGSPGAKGGAIDVGVIREQAPADLRIPGLSRSTAVKLHDELRDAATARLQQLLGRFESTLRDRAAP